MSDESTQRANIQFSVPLNNLAPETLRLLHESDDWISGLPSFKHVDTDSVLSLSTLQEIDTTRRMLTDIDIRLSEISNIINGYLSFKTSSTQPTETQSLPQPQALDQQAQFNFDKLSEMGVDAQGINELKTKIDSFRAMMNGVGDTVENTDKEQNS